MDAVEGLQKCFLHDVFRFHGVIYNSQAGIVHGFIIEFIDPELRIAVTGFAVIDDLLVNIYVCVFQNPDFSQKTRKNFKSYNFPKIN
jgi:hypothetical protein